MSRGGNQEINRKAKITCIKGLNLNSISFTRRKKQLDVWNIWIESKIRKLYICIVWPSIYLLFFFIASLWTTKLSPTPDFLFSEYLISDDLGRHIISFSTFISISEREPLSKLLRKTLYYWRTWYLKEQHQSPYSMVNTQSKLRAKNIIRPADIRKVSEWRHDELLYLFVIFFLVFVFHF